MNVQELINQLNNIKDKTKEVVESTPDGYIIVDAVNICSWSGSVVLSSEQ